MRKFLLAQSNLLQLATFTKAPFSMGSIREFRTLARCPQLAISEADDEPEIRAKYRPFLLDPEIEEADWISELELDTTISMAEANLQKTGKRLRILVLYGSLRKR
jgi:arsenic resistance protein ArsH